MKAMPRVLVVDDDEHVGRIAAIILMQKGYEVLQACNGLEALMVYSSYRQKIDLVLTDVDMPQMNGLELAGRIRGRDPARRILLMSGGTSEDLGNSKDHPFLAKPFLSTQLIAAVEAALTVT
jgi:DNA-binding NtrC family response regulator